MVLVIPMCVVNGASVPELTLATMNGATVNPDRPVTFAEPFDQGDADDMVTVTSPVCILYGIPSITLVFSCDAVSVLPNVKSVSSTHC